MNSPEKQKGNEEAATLIFLRSQDALERGEDFSYIMEIKEALDAKENLGKMAGRHERTIDRMMEVAKLNPYESSGPEARFWEWLKKLQDENVLLGKLIEERSLLASKEVDDEMANLKSKIGELIAVIEDAFDPARRHSWEHRAMAVLSKVRQ